MPRGTIEERRAWFRARRLWRLGWAAALGLALTRRSYPVSLETMMNFAKDTPPDTIPIPATLLGASTAVLLVAGLLCVVTLIATRQANSRVTFDKIALARLALFGLAPVLLIDWAALLLSGIANGW